MKDDGNAPKERAEALEAERESGMAKRTKAVIAASVALVAVVAMGGFAFATAQPEIEKPQSMRAVEQDEGKAAGDEKARATIRVEAEGWTEESTPVIVHVEGGDEDFYRALKANAEEALELAPGEYEFEWVSPVNSDGSIYETGDAAKVEVGEDGAKVSATFKRIETADAMPGQVEAVLKRIREAVERGGESLPDGAAIVEKAEANAAKDGKPDEEKPAAEGEGAGQEAASGQANGSESPNASAGDGSGSQTAQANSGASGSSQKPSQPEKRWVEEQGHYEDVYEQQWVPNIVEIKPKSYAYQFSDGHIAYTDAEYREYSKTHDVSSHMIEIPAVTEDRGSYQQVKTGTKWVVDVPGHWE